MVLARTPSVLLLEPIIGQPLPLLGRSGAAVRTVTGCICSASLGSEGCKHPCTPTCGSYS